MNYWFTSDFHLNHVNILKYSNRPFKTISEMNEAIINNWNNCVKDNDDAYFLGDFMLGNERDIFTFLRRLKGNIKIIFGNHDKTLRKVAKRDIYGHTDLKDRVKFLGDYHEITIDNQFIVLTHYALRVFNRSHYGSWNLYAHSHGSLPDDPHSRSIDVGVDCHNFTPINFDQIKQIMDKKLWRAIDHHGERLEGGGVGLSKKDYARLDRKRQYEQLKKEFEKEKAN